LVDDVWERLLEHGSGHVPAEVKAHTWQQSPRKGAVPLQARDSCRRTKQTFLRAATRASCIVWMV
jgi:hypothetical protein